MANTTKDFTDLVCSTSYCVQQTKSLHKAKPQIVSIYFIFYF